METKQPSIVVVGLGYVGLPLAVEFAKFYPTLGFDIDSRRVTELRLGQDSTREVSAADLAESDLRFTNDADDITTGNFFVVTVPTPIDAHKQPDLGPLVSAARVVGEALNPGDTVVFESTVYPGATEEVCVPILVETSGLTFNVEFTVGYSPERINPGDKTHKVSDIVKVTSGSTARAARYVDEVYGAVISAGTFPARSIKVAEAAKVIENTQRDVNIALVNELALLFDKLGISTTDVLEAAGTKWNFLPFKPGLVGGHCIGVDPFYLTYKAQACGHHPEIILAGRRINDSMGQYIGEKLVLEMARKGIPVGGSRVLILGLTFKENCPDLRNTKVVDVIDHLHQYGITVDVADPWVDPVEAKSAYGIDVINLDSADSNSYRAAIVAVGHAEFAGIGERLRDIVGVDGILYDIKSTLLAHEADVRL